VSQFAAGCAICGEDLVAARQRRERRSVPSMPGATRLPRISGQDALIGGLMIVNAFAAPIIGGVIASLFAYRADNDRDLVRRNLCLIAVGVAIVMICLISLLPGTYNRLLLSLYG
jgi:hypothetical protein